MFWLILLVSLSGMVAGELNYSAVTWNTYYQAQAAFYVPSANQQLYYVVTGQGQYLQVVDAASLEEINRLTMPNSIWIDRSTLAGSYPVFLDLHVSPPTLYWMNTTTLYIEGGFQAQATPSTNGYLLATVDSQTVLLYSPSVSHKFQLFQIFSSVCFHHPFSSSFFFSTNFFFERTHQKLKPSQAI